jgi:hypothetical protein
MARTHRLAASAAWRVEILNLTNGTGQLSGAVFEFGACAGHVGEPLSILAAGSNAPELAPQIAGDWVEGVFVAPFAWSPTPGSAQNAGRGS